MKELNYAIAVAFINTEMEMVEFDSRILIGVRKPKSNAQHPNIVSIPTQRIPAELFGAIKARIGLSPAIGRPGDDPIAYAVQCLMSQKLSMGHLLELGEVEFIAAAQTVFSGVTPILSDGDKEIAWKMVQIQVYTKSTLYEKGSRHFPEETVSYSDLRWPTIDKFLEMADDKESGMGGLCIDSTANWLRQKLSP